MFESHRLAVRTALVVTWSLGFGMGIQAQVIDFENPPSTGNSTYTSLDVDGFRFTASHFHTIDIFTPSGGVAHNGSGVVIGTEGGSAGPSTLTMARIDGAPFDVSSFEAAEMWLSPPGGYPNATSIRVTAMTAGGTPLDTTFLLDGQLDGPGGVADYESFILVGYASVMWVQFEGMVGTTPDHGYCIDNIDLAPSGCLIPYGVGCAGTGGFAPQLSLGGCSAAGGPINVNISQGLGGSAAVLFLGASQVSIPVGLSACTLLVGPPQLPVLLTLSGTGAGAGSLQLFGSLPVGSTGATFTMQALVADAVLPHGFSATGGLQITVQ